MKRSQDEVFEFACRDGNAGLHGILAGPRAQEQAAEKAAKREPAVDLCNLLNKIVTIDIFYKDKGRK